MSGSIGASGSVFRGGLRTTVAAWVLAWARATSQLGLSVRDK